MNGAPDKRAATEAREARETLLCPSARPEPEGGFAFGVVLGTAADPRVAYLATPQPVTDDLLLMTQPAAPTEVFRFAAACAGTACQHFDGAQCRLATRIANYLPPVVEALPACGIRSQCRWWHQEGRQACLRCPQVVSLSYMPSDELRRAAEPTAAADRPVEGRVAGEPPTLPG